MAEIDEWVQQAKCRGRVDLQDLLFFSDHGAGVTDGKRFCAGELPEHMAAIFKDPGGHCPVRDQCLNYAIDNHIALGLWGGKSERERRGMQRIRRRQRLNGDT